MPNEGDFITVRACRSCGSRRLSVFWSGGPMNIVEFPVIGTPPKKPKVPLDLMVCENCWLVQLGCTTNPDYLYEEFWYRSGTNEMMRRELGRIVSSARFEAGLWEGDWVLDIGCNDGTLLGLYPVEMNLHTVGIDPAKNIVPSGMKCFINNFFSDTSALTASCGQKYSVVTALAMFYDLDDPLTFCKQVERVLDPEGVFILQMNYLPTMLMQCGIDNVCHEHLTYFSLETLLPLFTEAGLAIYKVELNGVNGGSIRVYAKHYKRTPIMGNTVMRVLSTEREMRLNDMRTYVAFADRVESVCASLDSWLELLYKNSRRVYAYGASTRGATLLQLLSNTKLLVACAERDERKVGRYISGTDLTVVGEDEFRKKAEYGLVLPHHFMPAILEREKTWLGGGGTMIAPLPVPKLFRGVGNEVRSSTADAALLA
jgi:hypothetical protein